MRKPMAERRTPTFSEPMLVVLQFESSGSWPDDVAAIANIKRAFFLKLAHGYVTLKSPGLLYSKQFDLFFFADFKFVTL